MIVFPMAGLSSRFSRAGYDQPKFMLKLQDKTLFDWSVLGFREYFNTDEFVFIVRAEQCANDFVEDRCKDLGILKYQIIVLEEETEGQASTVYLGLRKWGGTDEDKLIIFNIDTFRPKYRMPQGFEKWDGYLEVFRGEGDNWSYAKAASDGSTLVVRTAEKEQISNLCSTGLYFFSKVSYFYDAYEDTMTKDVQELAAGERYIAPLYNFLINNGRTIHYNEVSTNDVVFCGTPEEYEEVKINYILPDMFEHVL